MLFRSAFFERCFPRPVGSQEPQQQDHRDAVVTSFASSPGNLPADVRVSRAVSPNEVDGCVRGKKYTCSHPKNINSKEIKQKKEGEVRFNK